LSIITRDNSSQFQSTSVDKRKDCLASAANAPFPFTMQRTDSTEEIRRTRKDRNLLSLFRKIRNFRNIQNVSHKRHLRHQSRSH